MNTVRPLYTDGKKTSPILRDLIGDTVCMNPDFIFNRLTLSNGCKQNRYSTVEHQTPFEGICVVPFKDGFDGFGDVQDFRGNGSRKIDGAAYLQALDRAVSDRWDPDRTQLVFMSSGFDSRLISHFIRRNYEADPAPILFVCWGAECEAFEAIMKYQGWDPAQYFSIATDLEHIIYSFRFCDAWKHANGASQNFAASMFHVALDYLRETGRIPVDPDDLNIWTGLGNNEQMTWPGGLAQVYKKLYYGFQMRMWGAIDGADTMQPLLDAEVGKVVFSGRRSNGARRRLLAMADPKLASLPRTKTSRKSIPGKDLAQMVADFKGSFYYRYVERVPDPGFNKSIFLYDGRQKKHHEFFRKWTVASLVEKLIKKGIEIDGPIGLNTGKK